MARTPINDPTLPNLHDDRAFWNTNVYRYYRTTDGAVLVRTVFSGAGDGIGAGGKRFPSVEAAAAAVLVAREKVAAWMTRNRYPFTLFPLSKEG